MESKLTLTLTRSFFAIITIVSIGVCFKEQSSESTSYQTIRNNEDEDEKGYYQTIDNTNKDADATLLTFGIIAGTGMLALGLTFVGKKD